MQRIIYLFVSTLVLASVTQAQPLNDNCINSTPITVPASGSICVNGTLANATDDGLFSNCENAGSNEVWFTYIATGANNTITVSPTGGIPATNLVVSIMSSVCGSNTIDACNSAATSNGTATANWAYTPGTQVWIFVSSNSASQGTFQLCVNSITTPPSTGKDCTTAAPMCNVNSFTATVAPGSNGFRPPCFTAALQKPIIFKFTVGQTGLLNWRATPTCGPPNATRTEFDWAVYDITNGCPGTAVACNYNFTGSLPFMIPTTAPQGMQGGPAVGCNNTLATGNTALEICQGVTVTAGRTYVIILDQYTTPSSCTIDFNFTGSTFQMAPSSLFTVSPSTGCGNILVTFNNASSGATTYSWDFGDGDTSNLQNPPAKTYTIPGTYLTSLTTTSASGCTAVYSQPVQIFPTPTVTVNSDTLCPGQSATLTATPSIGGGTYLWSPGGATTSSITVSPATTTIYTVTYSLNTCSSTAAGTVSVAPAFSVNAGTDTVICLNQSIQLNGTVQPAGTYTYQWSPTGTLTNANTLNPISTPTASETYTLSVTDGFGCSRTDQVQVFINGVGISVNSSATPGVVCPGEITQLNANILPVNCGPTLSCAGNLISGSMGSGTTPQPGTVAQPPTLMGNYNKSGRNQMLYTAAELSAALGGPSVIKVVSFDIAFFNSAAFLENFTLKMSCTNLTALNSWQNNLTTVFFSATPGFQPTTGWNSIVLNTPFAWDGVSNVVVEVCWFNPTTFGTVNNKARCTTTAFNSYLHLSSNNDLCGLNNAPTVSTLRPNMRFNYCIPDINTYSISWTPSTGTGAVSNPSISNPTANPVSNTNYTIQVATGGCDGTGIVTVLVDTSRVNAGLDLTACPGNTTTLTATPIGSLIPGPPVYTWTTLSGTPIGSTQSINVAPATTTSYVVAMIGGNCIKYDTVTVTINNLNINTAATNVTCQGAANGKIKVLPQGVSPFTFTWSANALTGNVDSAINLPPGNYSVTVTDASGCIGSATAIITQPTQLAFTSAVTNVSCFGGSNGAIAVTPSGGTGSNTYQWSNSLPATSTIGALSSGTYTVTVLDSNLCSVSGSITISQPSQIVFGTANITHVRCFSGNNGSIIVSGAGGTGNYTYGWSHVPLLNSPVATNLTAGTYIVTITDANNCTATSSNTVNQPASGITFNAPTVTNVTCYGGNDGAATVNATGGSSPYNYVWSPSNQTSQTATGLSAQVYNITVTDDSLCTATTTVTINQPAQIVVSGIVTNAACFGNANGAIDVTITNGIIPFGFQWSNLATSEDLTGIAAGGYNISVTDNTGCTQSALFTVTEPAELLLNSPTIVNVSCFGGNNGSVTANPNGGTGPYTYSWLPSGNTRTVSLLTSGTYLLTVTDANGCTISGSYQVTEPSTALIIDSATIANVLCNGFSTGSITISASGGTGAYVYSWSHNNSLNSASATSLSAGTFSVTITDANGCSVLGSYNISQPSAITFTTPTIMPVNCSGGNDGSATINVSGGTGSYTYRWNGVVGNNPETNLSAGTYTVVVTDANSCSASTQIAITHPPLLSVSLSAQDATCFGATNGTAEATPSGGNATYTFLWSDAQNQTTQIATGLSAGTYFCLLTDATGCTANSSVQVNEPALLTFTTQATQVRCPGERNGTITIAVVGGTPPYNYSATLDGTNFVYSTNGIISNLAAGTYQVLVTDNNGCSYLNQAIVLSPVPDEFTYTSDSTSCYGAEYNDGAVYINALTFQNTPYTYGVDGGLQQYSGDIYNLTAGIHIVTAINNWGCVTDITVYVPEPQNGIVSVLPGDTLISLGTSVMLNTAFSPYSNSTIVSYQWSPSEGLSCADCPDPIATPYNRDTDYRLIVTYNGHCTASATINILITNNAEVYVPNAFSPNGDGNNDTWMIYSKNIKIIDLKIFNRWGEKIFESDSQFYGWDGTYKGALQLPGVYVYTVSITFLDDTKVERNGSITILR